MGVDIFKPFSIFQEGIEVKGPIVSSPDDSGLYRTITVDPAGIQGTIRTIQAAIDYVGPRSTVADPWTIRLLPGIYTHDTPLDMTNLSGVNMVGAGSALSIIRASDAFFVSGVEDLIDVSDSNDIMFRGVWIDARTNATIANTGLNIFAGVLANTANRIRFDSCKVSAVSYPIWVSTGTAGHLIELYNSITLGGVGCRSHNETWHIFSCELRGERTDNTQFAGNTVPTSFQVQGASEVQIWGSHLHAEDASSTDPFGIDVITLSSGGSIEVLGSTLHVKVLNDTTLTGRSYNIVRSNTAVATASARIAGSNIIIDAGNTTEKSAIITPLYLQNAHSSQVFEFSGNTLRETVGVGPVRGAVIRSGGGTAVPIVRWQGGPHSPNGFTPIGFGATGTTIATVQSRVPGLTAGSATLASGAKIVLLVTDEGDTAETAASFTSAGTSVTGGVAFDTIFRAGEFVRLSTHTDATWSQIKTVTATTLTLYEGYRGATGGPGTARRATQNAQTQPDGTYFVNVTADVTGETFSVTTKHRSGFTITSSDVASTAVVDWILTR